MSLAETFGAVIRELRLERGLSQEQLGYVAGHHRTYVSLLERGLSLPSLTTLWNLAAALEVAPSVLVERVEDRERQG